MQSTLAKVEKERARPRKPLQDQGESRRDSHTRFTAKPESSSKPGRTEDGASYEFDEVTNPQPYPQQPNPSPTPLTPTRCKGADILYWDESPSKASDNSISYATATCKIDVRDVRDEKWKEQDVYEMSGGLGNGDDALSVSSDDNTICTEVNELFHMPNRLVGRRSVALLFLDPETAWDMLPQGFHITAKDLRDVMAKFHDDDDEGQILNELLRRGGICADDVAYLEDLIPCDRNEMSRAEPLPVTWGKPWVPTLS